MDKLICTITFKVPHRVYSDLKELALERGVNLSDLCRKWCFQKLHESRFHMKDFINNDDDYQV